MHVARKDYVKVCGLEGLTYRDGGIDFGNVQHTYGRITLHAAYYRRGPRHYNYNHTGSFFGLRRSSELNSPAVCYTTSSITKINQVFEGAELFIIHSLDQLFKSGNSLWIFYGSKIIRDISPPLLSNRIVVAQDEVMENEDPEDLNSGQKRFFEYHLYKLGSTNLTGIWVKGKVLNYRLSIDTFKENASYFVGHPMEAIDPKKTSVEVPRSKTFTDNGLVFIGTYHAGHLYSSKYSRTFPKIDVPVRSLNKYLRVSSLLSLLERVKGGLAQW
jgi:hypothetical protein